MGGVIEILFLAFVWIMVMRRLKNPNGPPAWFWFLVVGSMTALKFWEHTDKLGDFFWSSETRVQFWAACLVAMALSYLAIKHRAFGLKAR